MEFAKQKEIAESYFKHYPQENTIYICEDGNVFLESNRSDGSSHANLKGLQIFTFKKSDLEKVEKKPESKDDGKKAPKKDATILPEANWKKGQLIAWLKDKGFEVAKNITDEKLKAKVSEVVKTINDKEAERKELIAKLTEKAIEFDAEASTEELLEVLKKSEAVNE